jgi:choline dehydrogenase-like flavoprotein
VPGQYDAPRSRPYPLPPLPVKSSGALFERGCAKLGYHPQPTPLAILSQPFHGRQPCHHCGFCLAFGCEFGAKSSTLATVIPMAEATGHCEIRPNSYVRGVGSTRRPVAPSASSHFDEKKVEHLQRARAVVPCANG